MTGHKVCGTPLADGDPESIGDFVLEGRLGTGGMGVVYLARSALGRQVAVKVVHERFAEDPEFRARFGQEVNAVRRVSGAFTAPVIDADTDCVFPWMATQYISGMPLSDRVKKHGPLSSDQLWRLAAGLAEALRDIHRAGVVHRDLKPANVLMHHDGPRVIDFGISRAAGNEVRTRTGQVMGTPPFMAPEQFVAAREVGPAADVFALGSVLVYAATGHGPFDIDNPNVAVIGYRVVHDEPNMGGLSGVMREMVACCLEKAAEKRPTAEELLDMLHSVQTEHERLEAQNPSGDLSTAPTTTAPTPMPPAHRRRIRSAAAAAGALCLAAVAFLAIGADTDTSQTGTNTSQSASPRTPDGWRPWHTVFPVSDGHPRMMSCTPDATGVFCSSDEIALMKLDPATGRMTWKNEMRDIRRRSGSSVTSPRVHEGIVYTYSADREQGVDAFDAVGGRRRWHFDGPVAEFAYLSGVVIIREGEFGSGNTATYAALDPQTGKKLWRRTLTSSSPSPLYAGPDGTLYADLRSATKNKDSASSRILQLRADTGKTVHHVEAPKGDLWLAAVHNGTAYYPQWEDGTGVSGRLLVQNLTTGKTRRIDLPWSVNPEAPPLVHGSTIYFFDYRNETILALDLDSGKPLWTSSLELRIFGEPAVYDDRLYVTMPNTSVLVLDARTGKQLWRTKTSFDTGDLSFSEQSPTEVAPLVVGDIVYGVTDQGAFSVSAHRPDV